MECGSRRGPRRRLGLSSAGRLARGWAWRQETDIRAPPRSESPTCQRPPVERTMESPMARPRPAPEPCSVARWNRSNSRDRSACRDAGAAVLHDQADPAALGQDADPDLAAGTRVTARVVDQHAGQPVDPLRRRADQHRGAGSVRGQRPGRRTGSGPRTPRPACPGRPARRPGAAAGSRTGPATACPRPAGASARSRPGYGSARPGTRPRPAARTGPRRSRRGSRPAGCAARARRRR